MNGPFPEALAVRGLTDALDDAFLLAVPSAPSRLPYQLRLREFGAPGRSPVRKTFLSAVGWTQWASPLTFHAHQVDATPQEVDRD